MIITLKFCYTTLCRKMVVQIGSREHVQVFVQFTDRKVSIECIGEALLTKRLKQEDEYGYPGRS